MQTCDTLLHAGVLLTQDDDRRVLENAALAIDGGRIVGCGTHSDLLRSCETYREIALSQLSAAELGQEG